MTRSDLRLSGLAAGEFLPEEPNAVVKAAPVRKVQTCFDRFLAGQSLCSQSCSYDLQEELKPEMV